MNKEKKKYSLFIFNIVVLIVALLVALGIAFGVIEIFANIIDKCNSMMIVSIIWMTLGVVIPIYYEISGGYLNHQKFEGKLFGVLSKIFDIREIPKVGSKFFTCIGLGFFLAGVILQMIRFLQC